MTPSLSTKLVMTDKTEAEIKQVQSVAVDEAGCTQPRWEAEENSEKTAGWTVSSDVFGLAKHRRPTSYPQAGLGVGNRSGISERENERAPGKMFGQDRVGAEEIYDSDQKATLLWVNDGHGNVGERTAAEVASHLIQQYSMPGKLSQINVAIRRRDASHVQQIMEQMWQQTAAHLRKQLGQNEGGSTCSHALVTEVDGRHYVVTANMGDSPVVIVDPESGAVLQTHGVHNWDNEAEYRLYDKMCRERGVPTSKAVYNRFNCGNGQLPGPNNDCAPIEIFRRSVETGLMEVDPTNLAYITKVMAGWGVVGGFQGEARMVMQDEQTGEVKAPLPGFGHMNWGSVVLLEDVDSLTGETVSREGGAQCTRSFADWQEQRLACTIGDTPTVNVTAVSKNAVVLVMSDGAADVIGYMHLFGKKVKEIWDHAKREQRHTGKVGVEAKTVVEGLAHWVMERGATTANYGLKDGLPTWDDVTIASATFCEDSPDTTQAQQRSSSLSPTLEMLQESCAFLARNSSSDQLQLHHHPRLSHPRVSSF